MDDVITPDAGKRSHANEGPVEGIMKLLPSRARLPVATAILVAALVVATALGAVPRWHRRTALAAETLDLAVPTVNVVSPRPAQATGGIALPAEVKPWTEAPLLARANGYLKRRLVDIGDHVETGQLLAEIDTPELDRELERARAQLAQAEATLGLSRITAARWTELVKTASVSEQETAEKQADLALKTAVVGSARAEVRRLEKVRSFTRVTAPFAGVVTARNVDVGDLIVAGSGRELFHLAETRRLKVYVQVPQAMARAVVPGQAAEISVPELPGRVSTAKVIRTAGAISADSRTLLVELEVDNPKGDILAGGYAQLRFVGGKTSGVLTLPANALLFRSEGPQVAIVAPDGKVELRKVKLGRDFGQSIEILEGVTANDRAMVNPSDSLVSGATVRIAAAVVADRVR
jgi:RND family efflux transporter MFP subunit